MEAALPLTGLKVVELCSSFSGPLAAENLAMLGADVIKVEPPGGDVTRSWGPPLGINSAAGFEAVNREKKSIVIDFNDAAQKQTLIELIQNADVLIQNLRPGLTEALALDGKTMCASNPRLVYCNVGAFGRKGPLRNRPGYDPLMQAFSGIMSVTGEESGNAARVGVPVIDFGTGLWTTIGVLSALFRRSLTGEGCVVDSCLFETGVHWMKYAISEYHAGGPMPGRMGTRGPAVAPNRAYNAADQGFMLCIGTDNQFKMLCEVIGQPELADNPAFAKNQARKKNEHELDRLLEAIFATDTRDHWLDKLEAAGLPHAPLLNISELLAHPQMQASGLLQHQQDSPIDLIGLPLVFNGQRPEYRRPPPHLNQHAHELMEGVQCGEQSIQNNNRNDK